MQLLASEEYGLRCLLRVSGAPGTDGGPAAPVPIASIAAAEGLSAEYTAKLMRMLRLGGIVESVRGAEGGYRLARPARAISLWSALEALGGAFFDGDFCACHPGQQRDCVRSRDCSLRALWTALQQGLRTTLEGISLADLQRDERTMVVWMDEHGAGDVGKHFAGI